MTRFLNGSVTVYFEQQQEQQEERRGNSRISIYILDLKDILPCLHVCVITLRVRRRKRTQGGVEEEGVVQDEVAVSGVLRAMQGRESLVLYSVIKEGRGGAEGRGGSRRERKRPGEGLRGWNEIFYRPGKAWVRLLRKREGRET
ncbi:hypothetical protein E2C01_047436 [Portunus trituberculatus]|uniref:Uncharacterized protein n=1 Tax=Portunus trituberculatus TaxID=210409 RepID=A0A5B7G138_PORTR|nr:hypothetical protein [Portunus trituberculatus]